MHRVAPVQPALSLEEWHGLKKMYYVSTNIPSPHNIHFAEGRFKKCFTDDNTHMPRSKRSKQISPIRKRSKSIRKRSKQNSPIRKRSRYHSTATYGSTLFKKRKSPSQKGDGLSGSEIRQRKRITKGLQKRDRADLKAQQRATEQNLRKEQADSLSQRADAELQKKLREAKRLEKEAKMTTLRQGMRSQWEKNQCFTTNEDLCKEAIRSESMSFMHPHHDKDFLERTEEF